MPNMNALATRHTLHQALRWRDLLWASILDDLEWRDPARAHAVYDVLAERPTVAIVGQSTASARIAWPYLDLQAREDWVWVAQFVQHAWVRGALGADAPRADGKVSTSPNGYSRIDSETIVADVVSAPF
jgi:hypothetical protein